MSSPLTDRDIQLAKRLAATDKKIREKALKALETFLKNAAELSELDMMKLWKALFYCIWMTDKPLVQHELARRMAEMTHLVSADRALVFLRAFWQTMLREWNGIDKHRLDKFYALMRYFTNTGFKLLRENGWSADAVDAVCEMMQELPFNPAPHICKRGVQFHILDVYIEELAKIEPDFPYDLSADVIAKLLTPIFHLTANAEDKSVNKRVASSVFEPLIEALSSSAGDGDEEKAKVEKALQTLAKAAFDLASAPATNNTNRGVLYAVRKEILKATSRPGKRKRDEDAMNSSDSTQEDEPQQEEQQQPVKHQANKKQQQQQQQKKTQENANGNSNKKDFNAELSALLNAEDDEDSEDDGDYDQDEDEDGETLEDHLIMNDSDDDDDGEGSDEAEIEAEANEIESASDSDDMDEDEDDDNEENVVFLPPSTKRRKLFQAMAVLQHLQRIGTGMEEDIHYYVDEDLNRDAEDDEDDSESDIPVNTDLTAAPAVANNNKPAPAAPSTPSTPSSKKVKFDMSKVQVQEYDKFESPSTVQSPRQRPAGSARPILKTSPNPSPMSSHGKKAKKMI